MIEKIVYVSIKEVALFPLSITPIIDHHQCKPLSGCSLLWSNVEQLGHSFHNLHIFVVGLGLTFTPYMENKIL